MTPKCSALANTLSSKRGGGNVMMSDAMQGANAASMDKTTAYASGPAPQHLCHAASAGYSRPKQGEG
jgi:hypothetical protein